MKPKGSAVTEEACVECDCAVSETVVCDKYEFGVCV